jgi:hypothetical protein
MIPFSKRNASYDNLTIEGAVFCGSIVLEAFIVSYSHQRKSWNAGDLRPRAKLEN